MTVILRTMLAGNFRDVHTLVWTILFPAAMLIVLGLYMNDPAYSQRLVAGVLTTNVLFGATITTAFHVMAQRNRGIYKMLRVTPFSTAAFICVMTGARTILTLLVSGILVLIGYLLFGVTVTLPGLLLMIFIMLLGSVCFTALGFTVANFSKNENNVSIISNMVSFPMLFTSEAFYSMQNAPDWLLIIAGLQPFHYFVDAMSASIRLEGLGAHGWLSIAVLAAFSALCLAIAVVTFRWDTDGATPVSRWSRKKKETAA